MQFEFTKMHGLGNCFILMDDLDDRLSATVDAQNLARAVCDRDFGIGADGLILVQRSPIADLKMSIINEDGSLAEMCGNGVRCFARFSVENAIIAKRDLAVDTLAGIIRTTLLDNNDVRVDLGEPAFHSPDVRKEPAQMITIHEQNRDFTFVSMGNPHVVTFVDNFDFPWQSEGQTVESAPPFPQKTNVEFVRVLRQNEIEMKVWERGCGATKACGTGAAAAVVAGTVRGLLSRKPVTVHLPGGSLTIEWSQTGRVLMTGPATSVCRGTYWLYS